MLASRRFPEKWLSLIQRQLYFSQISARDRAELLGPIQSFLAEKNASRDVVVRDYR